MSDCEIQADPDLLGIGVRLGFYFQFASNLVLLFTRQDEAVQSITLSNLFMIAYFIAAIQSLILNNLPPGAVIPITSFFFLDGSLATVIYFATLQTMSYWTHVVFMVRYAGICGFHLWFWFSGVHVQHSAQCIEPRVWMFGNFPVYGGIDTFYEIFAIVMSLFTSLGFLKIFWDIRMRFCAGTGPWRARWAMLPNPQNARQQVIGNQEGDHAAGMENGQQVPGNQDPVTWVKLLTVLITGSLVLGLVIIGVELEIRWNKLANMNTISSTGQILPLVVGTMTLARALVLLLIDILDLVYHEDTPF